MSRLDIAAKRFEAALKVLEQATDPLVGLRGEAEETAARLAELSEEREQLLARIAELEEENLALSGVTEDVEGRLDSAIGEIRAALGS